MVRPLSKKGVFFTFISILFLFLFFIFLELSTTQERASELNSEITRVGRANALAKTIESEYLPAITTIVANDAIRGMLDYVNDTRQGIARADQQLAFVNLIVNQTMPGSSILRTRYNLSSLITNLTNVLEKELHAGVDLNFSIEHLNLSQAETWLLQARVLYSYSLSRENFNWTTKSVYTIVNISIIGLNDPLYAMNGSNITIARSELPILQRNISLLSELIRLNEFQQNVVAPSFLQRLANETDSSIFGIESLINPEYFGIIDKPINRSYVDYLFFNTEYDCLSDSGNYLYEIDNTSFEEDLKGFRIHADALPIYLNESEYTGGDPNTTRVC